MLILIHPPNIFTGDVRVIGYRENVILNQHLNFKQRKLSTVETRLLEVDGTRGNTSSNPKFELNIGSFMPIFSAFKSDLQCSS